MTFNQAEQKTSPQEKLKVRPPRPAMAQGDLQAGSEANLGKTWGKADGPPAAPSDRTG